MSKLQFYWLHEYISLPLCFPQVCQSCQGSTYLRAVLWAWAWAHPPTPTLIRCLLTPRSSDPDHRLDMRTLQIIHTFPTPCWCTEDPRCTQEWPCLHRDPLCSLQLTPVLEDMAWTSTPNSKGTKTAATTRNTSKRNKKGEKRRKQPTINPILKLFLRIKVNPFDQNLTLKKQNSRRAVILFFSFFNIVNFVTFIQKKKKKLRTKLTRTLCIVLGFW